MSDYTEETYYDHRPRRSSRSAPRVENHYYPRESRGGYAVNPVQDWSGLDSMLRSVSRSIDEGFRDQNRAQDEAYRDHNRSLDRIERRQQDTNRTVMLAAIGMSIVTVTLFIILIVSYWS